MIEYKINILKELESSKQNIESQKRILEQEIKKFKFSTDENIVIKINELNSILDETDLDKEERYAKFTNGVKTLVTYLEKYERTISVVEMNAKEVAHKSAQSEVSFKIYPDIFNLKPVARNGFFVCVAAPTGVGKTRWMLNLMYHKYKEKKVSYFFSFEMTNEEVLFNLLAMDLFYRSYNPNTNKHDVILSKEDMEHEYRYCTEGKRKFYNDRLDDIFKYIRVLEIEKPTPKNIYFALTYKQHEHGETPEYVCIDHFHLMQSDNKDLIGDVSIYKDIAFNLYQYAKKTTSVFVILGQMDNKEKDDPKFYEESGWKWCGDWPTYVQHYWKLFRDSESPKHWLLYNAKLRNHTPVFEPYRIEICPANGAIISSKNEAIR